MEKKFFKAVFLFVCHQQGLSLGDVSITEDVLQVHLQRSKMDQHTCETDAILHSDLAGTPCPVRFMGKNSLARPNAPGPLFIHEDGSFLSHFQLVSVFSGRSLSRREFCVHSFCIGAASFTSDLGFFAEHIMAIGR